MHRRYFLKTTAAASALAPLIRTNTFAQSPDKTNSKVQEIRSRIKPITNEERLARQENARKLMNEQGIDALFVEGGTSMNYFTGVNWGRSERLFAMILPRNGDPWYIAPKFEESRAQEQTGNAKILTWEEHENPYKLTKQVFSYLGITTSTIGFEETTRQFVIEGIAAELPSARIVSGTPVTAGCRSIKSDHEIELMQIANDITAEVFQSSLSSLKEGMTEREFGSILSKLFSEFGVTGGALVLFGEASAHPHGLVKEHTLQENQIVLIDGGCTVEGYASDVTRTTVFGKPSEKMKTVWSIVRKAQDSALAMARPGIAAETIDAAARNIIVESGYGPSYTYFTHRLGHGIGMDGHEWYYLVARSQRPVQKRNMFSNEPGIYIVGEFGIRLEDEMLMTEDGAKLLLPQAKSLREIF